MNFGYSRYSSEPLNFYSSNYPYLDQKPFSEDKSSFIEENNLANSLINKRLDRLRQEKSLLSSQMGIYHRNKTPQISPYQQMAKYGSQIMNPYNINHYKAFNPMYYPLEIPGNGVPTKNPNYELGGPVIEDCYKYKDCCARNGNHVNRLLLILNALGYIPKPSRTVENIDVSVFYLIFNNFLFLLGPRTRLYSKKNNSSPNSPRTSFPN